MQRRLTTQDISWFIDLHNNRQLNLDPPYQRRSVWTAKDRKYFLDTIFRNYPSPAIFLHKIINSNGRTEYHVIDGKQRLNTILDFVNNNLKMSNEFGDSRLNSKRWKDIFSEPDLSKSFWNYQIPVEMIDFEDGNLVNQIFERLNRNSRKLTPQELRHAKYDGWLIQLAERETASIDWRILGVSTPGRSKRMLDTQFISELILVSLERRVIGFNQDNLDELYAKYDSFDGDDDDESGTDQVELTVNFESTKQYLLEMESTHQSISRYANTQSHLYSLWCLVSLNPKDDLPPPNILAEKYNIFMEQVDTYKNDLSSASSGDELDSAPQGSNDITQYFFASKGASTDFTPRKIRFEILTKSLIQLT